MEHHVLDLTEDDVEQLDAQVTQLRCAALLRRTKRMGRVERPQKIIVKFDHIEREV